MKKITALILFFISMNAWSDMMIETIPLTHLTADDVIPLVQPMIDPEGSITGNGYKLIIKSTPANISQIQTLIRKIDIDKNQLRIYVSYVDPSRNKNVTVASTATVNVDHDKDTANNDKIKFDPRIYKTKTTPTKENIQVMSVAEGYWGSISMGQAIPIAKRTRNSDGTVTESVRYEKIMTQFKIKPHTSDDNVTLTIQQHRQSQNQNNIDETQTETVINGKLGQWLFIGGMDHKENLDQSGIRYQTRIRSTNVNQLWIKVERP